MVLIQAAIAFFIAISLLVLVHEFGHYLVAQLCNVKVLRFSLGIGKVLFSRRIGKDQTEWAISLLPIGGYVMMLDAREQDLSDASEEELKREFNNQSVWRRFAIVLAGPVANFLLAIVILAGVNVYGIQAPSTKLRTVPENSAAWQAGLRGGELITAVNGESVRIWSDVRWNLAQAIVNQEAIQFEITTASVDIDEPRLKQIFTIPQEVVATLKFEQHITRKLGLDLARPVAMLGEIIQGGPAMKAGLKEGDIVLAVNGRKVNDALAFVELVRNSPEQSMQVLVLRNHQKMDFSLTPQTDEINSMPVGKIMVAISVRPEMILVQASLPVAMVRAVEKTWQTVILTVKMVWKMLVGEVSLKNVSGPITIADYAGQTARIGIVSYLGFVAFISISIGVMNLLPIPVLDGGLLLYYSIELLTGRKISERAGNIAQRVGLLLLLVLMAVAIFNDVVRLLF